MTPYYDDGVVTIYHGDCADILPQIASADVSLVLTDPPYGIKFHANNASRSRRPGPHGAMPSGRVHAPVHGDDGPFNPSHLLRFKRLVLWGANNYASKLPDTSSWLVWDRKTGASDAADAELAWTNLGGTVRMYAHLWNGVQRDSEIGYHVHPTQKPVALMRWIIDRWTRPDDLILDPYMGSGPVPRAAKDLGRRAIGVEIDERYCEIAAERLAQDVFNFGEAS